MNSTDFAGCCAAKIIFNLGTAHHWKSTTYRTLLDFARAISNTCGGSKRVLVTITSADQKNERKWLAELGFSSQPASNLLVHSCTYSEFMKRYKEIEKPKVKTIEYTGQRVRYQREVGDIVSYVGRMSGLRRSSSIVQINRVEEGRYSRDDELRLRNGQVLTAGDTEVTRKVGE